MISIKSPSEIEKLRKAGHITGGALVAAGKAIRPGMTTKELDTIIRKYITSHGAKPGFLGYGGFPGSACISVNDVVIHGIPGNYVFKEGDIVSVDTGAYINGYHGDSAYTFAVGEISDEAKRLLKSTEESLMIAIGMAKPGVRLGDIGAAIQKYNEANGFGVVREFVGHGVGKDLHEEPEVPNFGKEGHGLRLREGMVIAIEPMITAGSPKVNVSKKDGWTVTTVDGSLAAHFEHTIAITADGCEILSVRDADF
ncbi:methionyl aminopeptidase [Ruminococcus sp. YE71]|uniref:type I methionyl aminopeptidase n=1 Tax=unclassified Ruminococcus TaxID=2608920 RepID=UPI00088D2EA7|nr:MULTISPECIES: type I methionyl aminopeptidase [unclassified Ruminococcus]SDA09815.1 methionyl aminopeptidase [Ruminococcus sp. YE78]SFW11330.1 methionyl aminopeptidase [Ruminococcus sp. YE71]